MPAVKCKSGEVEVRKLTFRGVRKLRDSVKDIDLSSIETVFSAKESKDLTVAQVGLRAIRTIGLDAPEIILGLVQAFTDLKKEQIDDLEPAECLKIIEEGIKANTDVIKELSDSLKNLFSLSRKADPPRRALAGNRAAAE